MDTNTPVTETFNITTTDGDGVMTTPTVSDQAASDLYMSLMTLLIASIIFYSVPAIITTWRLFSKAGKPGWGAIVPVYVCILYAQIARRPAWAGIMLGILSLALIIPVVGILLSIVYIGLFLYILAGLIKQYTGVGIGFWLSYIFFPLISVFMVEKAQYVGEAAGDFGTPQTAVPGTPGIPAAPFITPPEPQVIQPTVITPPATPEQPIQTQTTAYAQPESQYPAPEPSPASQAPQPQTPTQTTPPQQ